MRAGIISAAVTNGILSIAAGMAGKSDYTPVNALDYMPFSKKPEEDKITIEQERAQWKMYKSGLKKRLRGKGNENER